MSTNHSKMKYIDW